MAILRQYHPDKNQDMPQDVANQKFREISEAFGFLWVKFMVFFLKKPTGDVHGNFSQAASCTTPLKTNSHGTPKKVCGLGRCFSPFPKFVGFFCFSGSRP